MADFPLWWLVWQTATAIGWTIILALLWKYRRWFGVGRTPPKFGIMDIVSDSGTGDAETLSALLAPRRRERIPG